MEKHNLVKKRNFFDLQIETLASLCFSSLKSRTKGSQKKCSLLVVPSAVAYKQYRLVS